ncbi:MAG: hypothetical protein NTY22_08050 [Proteobacteria bacterium]|nr:hypothetical protein [Pseudomonadota bacterium]
MEFKEWEFYRNLYVKFLCDKDNMDTAELGKLFNWLSEKSKEINEEIQERNNNLEDVKARIYSVSNE